MKYRRPFLLGIILSVLILSGCAKTTVTNVWIKGDFSGPPMRSLIVLAQVGDDLNRSTWENIIAERFQQGKMYSVPAVSIFSASNPDQVLTYAKGEGIDGVLVIRYADTRTLERYHPPETEYYYTERYYYPQHRGYYPKRPYPYRGRHPHPGHYQWYAPYVFYGEEVVVRPGYTTYHKVVRVESFLYSTWLREQVWSMATETIDPRSANQLIDDISRTVFKSLREYGLISLTR